MQEKIKFQKQFGAHLRKIREQQGISAAELARRCFMDKPHISRLENGGTNPTLTTLKKLCEALEISMNDLFKKFENEK